MHHTTVLKRLIFGIFALALLWAPVAFGQAITSAALSGFVTDQEGHPIAGAMVTAVHVPTNTVFTARSTAGGRFAFTGIPVGGPYNISAQAEGFRIDSISGAQVALGETAEVALVGAPSAEDVVQLEKFEVTADQTDLDSGSAGASSVLSSRRILAQPTVSRSFADLSKTNPFVTIRAGQQVQALGMNNRFNSITLDGAKINDSFGLNSSGLFSLNNPFSLDAVEQFSVSLTPYDVRQSGFAGAAINAVSKSGTNEFHGSIYNYITKSDWQGPDLSGVNRDTRPFLNENTYGATFGGPILKDRLFFFLNYEKFTRDSTGVSPAFTPAADFVSAVQAKLASLPSVPDMGSLGGSSTSRLEDEKRLLKLDWNITRDHRLSVRYSDTVGEQPYTNSINGTNFSQPVSLTGQPTSFKNGITAFSSNTYVLDVKEKVWAAQLFSDWTPDLKTQLSYSNTKQDSVRETASIFPEIRIFDVPGTSSAGPAISSDNAFRFGTEISSMGNELHIKTETLAGSADYLWNAFTFTVGADHEASDYYNLFRQGSYGYFDYSNLAAFVADTPFAFSRAVVQSGLPAADESKFGQTGVFAQAKWQPNARFTATAGVRVDYLSSPIAPTENTAFKNAFGITNAGTIDGTTVPAPRLSFNYAVDSERQTQVRGGLGVFLGRNPWVWISNSYGNTGVGRFNTTVYNTSATTVPSLGEYLTGTYSDSDPAFKFDANNPIGTTNAIGTSSSINLIKPGLKLPTVQRGNIAIDQKLPFLNAVLTLEYIDTRQLSALFVDNMNLRPMGVGADGRQRFEGSASSKPLVAGFANVIRTRNVHAGESQYTSISLDRPFKDGWAYNISYTRGHATEAQSLSSSTANSQWQFNGVFNQGQVEVSRSDYEVRDRIQAAVSRELRIVKNAPTTVSLYYEGRTGMPYSYVYGSDLNGDGVGTDLVAVPTGLNDPRFDFGGMTPAQRDAYFSFLQSSGLSRFAGSYAPRNAFLTPWQNRLDLRIVQELPAYKNVKIEVFADFLNFGAWLSPDTFNYIDLLNTTATNGGQGRLLGTATYGPDGRIKPSVTLDDHNNVAFGSTSTFAPNNTESRWKVQMGARLRF